MLEILETPAVNKVVPRIPFALEVEGFFVTCFFFLISVGMDGAKGSKRA
jgi:hypothetical protein